MAQKVEKLKGTTNNGFAFEIDPAALEDWEMIEDLSEFDEESKPSGLIRAAKRLLGADQYKNLKEHLKVDGRVNAKDMGESLTEIFTLIGEERKNS